MPKLRSNMKRNNNDGKFLPPNSSINMNFPNENWAQIFHNVVNEINDTIMNEKLVTIETINLKMHKLNVRH